MKLTQSPITQHAFNGNPFYLKRDDLLHPQFSGNKARKFMALLEGEFPGVETLVGYGSVQANSLYSLAALSAYRGWQLNYFVDHIPDTVRRRPVGNYRGALELGAEVIDLSQLVSRNGRHAADYIQDTFGSDSHSLCLPEGGRSRYAEMGVKELASEILNWKLTTRLNQLTVALPSGTGTTALYLQKYLKSAGVEVITCACVGGDNYLKAQFDELDHEAPKPHILTLGQKHHFGRLYIEDYQMWQALATQTHIEFELLYDPMMWRCLSQWMVENSDRNLLYIHQGGLLGNESMLPRYLRMLEGVN